jgi:quinol monooxygenase YgiN
MYLAARSADGQLETKYWTAASGYSSFTPLGGALASAPSATWASRGNAFYLFERFTDNQLYEKHWTAAGYSSFAPLGGDLSSAPSATWTPDGSALYVVTRWNDGAYYEKHWTAAGYSGWNRIGDPI